MASEAPVIRLVSLLINESVEQRASDIHIEPFENRLRVRYRVLAQDRSQDVGEAEPDLRFAIISRIKIMAKLNIAVWVSSSKLSTISSIVGRWPTL